MINVYSETALVFTDVYLLICLFNKICRNYPKAVCIPKDMYVLITYSKMKYRRGFPMPAANGIEVHIALNEFISAIKIPSVPST